MSLTRRTHVVLAALVAGLMLGPSLRARDDLSAEVLLQFAEVLFNEGRYSLAIETYEQARDLSTGRTKFRANLGVVQGLLRTADFRRARLEAEALSRAHPANATARALHGDALWAAGLFEEAETEYRYAATTEPNDARARNGLAKALAARNLLADALEEARASVRLAPRESEFHHTLGFVLERNRQYGEAAVSMRNYLNLIPNKERSEKAMWTAQQVRFLEAFKNREPLHVRDEEPGKVHTVPFRLVRDKVIVRGKVNGRRMDLVLDTGSEMTVVAQETARRMGLDPIVYTLSAGVGEIGLRGLQVGRMDRLEIGTLRVDNVPTLIKNPPLRGLPTQEVESFSPLALGYSMRLDYRRRLLTMARTIPAQAFDVELPLRHHRLALVRGNINGEHPVHFVVDTGGEVISVSKATVDNLQMVPVRRIPLKVYGTSGWDPSAFLLTGVDLAFASISMPNHAVVVLDLDAPSVLLGFEVGGIVGHRFLSRYTVDIDLQRSVLGLTAN